MALNRISYSLIGLFLIIAISCQKEDKVYPKVSIVQPSSPGSYSYGDTLLVEVAVDDLDGPLLVSLLDGDKTVSPGFTKQKVQGRIHFFQAIFDDPNLAGGQYSIRVLAYNGDNRSADFQNITYQITPRSSRGFALLMDDAGQKKLGFLSRSGSLSQAGLNGDYPYLAVSSSLGYLYTAPAYSGKLTAYDEFMNNIYDVSNPAPGGALQYRQLLGDGQLVYALDNEGYIRAYQASGSPVRNYQLDLGRIPIRAAINADGDFLVAAAEPGFGSYRLLLMNPLNGFVFKAENLSEFPMGVAYDSFDFYVLCADGGSSVLYKYTPSTGILQEWARIENENPVDIAGTADRCYLATDQGLYRVNGQSVPNQPFLPLSDRITSLPINDLSGSFYETSVYFATGENIYECAGTNIQMVGSVSGKQIRKIEILYNR